MSKWKLGIFLMNISNRIGIMIIGAVALTICVIVAYVKGRKEGRSPDEPDDEIERIINKTAGMNEEPWKAKEPAKEPGGEAPGSEKAWSKVEKAYEEAPRRANVKRIIWTEKQKDLQRIKDLQEREDK